MRLTARVTRLGWEGGAAIETGFRQSHEKAQKTRGLPQVGCTLCWAAAWEVCATHIGLFVRHYPNPREVLTDRLSDGMSLGRNS